MIIETKYPQLSVKNISQWEEKNNIEIPEPYKVFLLEYNGGSTGNRFSFKVSGMKGEFGLHRFFGIHEGLEGLDYILQTYTKRNRFPKHYFAIATDVAGNLILMGQSEKNLGEIFFWYHENEGDEDEEPYEDNIYKIAKDLKTFINSLYKDEVISYGVLSDIYDGDDIGIKELLESDWKVDIPDELNQTLIKRAVLQGKEWLVKELITRKADLSGTIEKAITVNHLKILKLLLKAGADTEEKNLSNNTSLQSAVMRNNPEIVALLLKYGANRNIKDEFGRTPLDVAILKKNNGIDMDEVIKLLGNVSDVEL